MTEPINLNKARKARAAAEAKTRAAENRVRFGRTKAQTSKARSDVARLDRALDQTRRDDGADR